MTGTWALNLFDRLHIGHHVLIDRLRDMPDPVAGVSDGELIADDLILSQLIQPVDIRVKNLSKYLKAIELDAEIRIEIVSNYDDLLKIKGPTTFMVFEGPCCEEVKVHTLKVRKEKLGINDSSEFLKPVMAGDGDKMSSARIRLGEIDRRGRRLTGKYHHPRQLPAKSRGGLKAPKGDVYSAKEGKPEIRVVQRILDDKPERVIAVGDVTSATLLAEGHVPDIMVIDGITKRGAFDGEFHADDEYTIYNPAATIYPEAWAVMDTAIRKDNKSLIIVEGEEDLMGFPAVLLAKHGSVILYGQPDVGIVWVPVNKENQELAIRFLEQMPVIP